MTVDQKVRNAAGKGFMAGTIVYIGIVGLPGLQGDGHANILPPEAAVKQEQVSDLEQMAYDPFKEETEEFERTDYEVAKTLAIEGSRRLGDGKETFGGYLLKKSLQIWEDVLDKKIKGIPASEYGATQYALAYFYVHSTLDAYFVEDNPFPNSLERLQKAKDLAQDALESYALAERTAEGNLSGDSIDELEAPAFNVLGLANEYMGNLKRAKECYKNAIERDDLDEARANLRTLGENNDVFIK